MKLNELMLREMRIYASHVGLHDSEGLARFHKECTPERILAILDRIQELERRGLEDRLEELEVDLEYYRDRCYDLEAELEEQK